MYEAIVLFDEDNTYHSKVSKSIEKVDNIKLKSINNEDAEEFIEKQFGFDMNNIVVVENSKVYVGDEAVKHLTKRQGVPGVVSDLIKSKSKPFSTVTSLITSGISDTDNINGEFPLDTNNYDQVDEWLNGTSIDF